MANYNYPIYPNITFDPKVDKVYSLTTDVTLAPGASRQLLLLIGDAFMRLIDQRIHFLEGEITYSIFQDVTYTDTGTPTFAGCVDLNITTFSTAQFYENPVGATGGVSIVGLTHFGQIGDISNYDIQQPMTIAAVTMKKMASYLFTITNTSAVTINHLELQLLWAE